MRFKASLSLTGGIEDLEILYEPSVTESEFEETLQEPGTGYADETDIRGTAQR